MAWGQMCHKCALRWWNYGAFGVCNSQRARANLACATTSLQCFFPLKGFVGDIDSEQGGKTLTTVL